MGRKPLRGYPNWRAVRRAARRAVKGETPKPTPWRVRMRSNSADLLAMRIDAPVGKIMSDYRTRLEDKVRELLGDKQIDEGRIATEIVIYSDKICVDEETVRLRSHIQSVKDTLNQGGSIGRKLDFIAQEMNREANTILSKANNLEISDTGINLKTDIEKVREQIQNIE